MQDNVYRFRRIKWGEPKKLKVLAEDFTPKKHPIAFGVLVSAVFVVIFCAMYLLS